MSSGSSVANGGRPASGEARAAINIKSDKCVVERYSYNKKARRVTAGRESGNRGEPGDEGWVRAWAGRWKERGGTERVAGSVSGVVVEAAGRYLGLLEKGKGRGRGGVAGFFVPRLDPYGQTKTTFNSQINKTEG